MTHAIAAAYTPDTTSFTASNGTTSQTVNKIGTTTTVASSANPSAFMQSVTFTATVAQTAGITVPTGTVQFSVDGTNVGSPVTLSGGTVSFAISTLAVGVHTITATYTPDVGDFAGSSGSIGQRVGAVATSTTTLSVAPATVMYGDTATLTAVVSPSFATGTVSFYDGSVLLGTVSVSNGVATLTTTTLNAGTHTVTAVYNGDATYAGSQSGPATVTVAKKTALGGGAALTITVQNTSREYNTADPQFAYVITGTLVNGDAYSTAVAGVPTYSAADTPTSPAGSTFPVSVSGLSSANYQIAVVNGTLAIVSAPTTTTLAASTASAQYGDPVTLAATVAPSGATGTVLFMEGSTVLGTAAVTNGVATLTTSSLPAGSYTIIATYEGDANYSASTSAPITLSITQRTGPGGIAALTVTVANASRPYGQGNPAFNYTVTGALVNGDTYATAITGVPVYATAAIPTSPAGGYPITAADLNSQNYLITFVNGTLAVTKATLGQDEVANIALTSSVNPSVYGNSVTFTAIVPAPATGTVIFYEGTAVLGTGTIDNGIATLTTSALAIGTHPVTAAYNGDVDYNSATSAVYSQVVTAQAAVLDFTLTLTSAESQTVIPGNAAPYTVQVAPTNVTYPGMVTFSATGLPAGATISFSPATVAPDGGVTPSSVKVQTAPQRAAVNSSSIGSFALALLMLPFATSRRIRKNSRRSFYLLIVLLGGIAATTGLTGCGYNGNGFFGQAPQTYNITITATSGTIQHSVNVTLNVQ